MDGKLMTFALLTYNQERFVEAALRSALAQTHQPLEILICDDLSTDATFDILTREVADYRGPHRLRLHRNASNLGCTGNTLSALAMAEADLVVFGAGDDISEPERVASIWRAAQAGGAAASSLWSFARLIDETGRESAAIQTFDTDDASLLGMARSGWAPCGATLACRKEVGATFGPVDPRAAYEDLVVHFRAALLGGMARLPEPLVRWRRHSASMDSAAALVGSLDAGAFAAATRRGVEQRMHCIRQRRRDLDTALVLWPNRRAELQPVIAAADRLVRDYLSLNLMGLANPLANLRGAAIALMLGRGPVEVLRRLMILRLPGLWLRWSRRRAGSSAAS